MRSVILTVALLLPAVPAAAQTRAEALGRELAGQGTLASLLPMLVAKDTEELVAKHSELNDAEKAQLRATAKETADANIGRLMDALGKAYAAEIPEADLATLVAFNKTPAAQHYRAAQPKAITASMAAMQGLDLKADTMKAFCARTGKGCEAKP